MKKISALLLSAVMVLSSFDLTLVQAASPAISSAYGWYEAIHLEWSNDSDPSGAKVEYKLSSDSTYTEIDSELIRRGSNGCVADVVGITSGTYDVRITASDGTELTKTQIDVARHDRSGYGHFGLSGGLGGYNDDGTPKSDADIIYVTNETKNSVKYGGNTGIGNILSNADEYSNPIIVRMIGKIDTQTRDADGTKTTDKNNGVIAINGLTDKELDADSYFNMLDVKEADNITVEGIGTDAIIEKWGFTFSKCNSIEIRNLTFQLYPEDACSFEGSSSSNSKYKNFWVHNNHFYSGENKYDLTDEQDKGEGDGSTDFKGCRNITYSYNVFEKCHKTSLHGGGDSNLQYNSTWHHNYFNDSSSRMPLTRQVNLHSYNNYFYSGSKCIDARASAWVLAEANYFDKSTGILTTASSSYGDPVVKSLNNVFANSSGTKDSAGTIVTTTDRTKTISATLGSNENVNPYPNFDTNTEWFYYDATNKKSDVEYLTDAESAKNDSKQSAGVMGKDKALAAYITESEKPSEPEPTPDPEPEYKTYVGTTVSTGGGESVKMTTSTFSTGDYTSSESSSNGVFTLNANSSKKITVNSNYIDLGGGGSATSPRNIAVKVSGPATISVKFFNNGSAERTLALADSNGTVLKTGVAPNSGSASSIQTMVCDVTAADTYYVYSTSGGIKVTEISVEYAGETIIIGDVELDNDIDKADAAMLIKSVAKSVSLSAEQLTAGDCDKNDSAELIDAIAILQYLAE